MSETILKPLTSNNAQNPYPDQMMLDLYNTDGVKNNIEHHEKTSQKNSKKPKDEQEKDEETTAILLEQNSSLPLPTMTETEIPVPVSESASSQAVKATTVSTSSSSSDGNGAIWGILGGLAGLGAIAGLAGGSKGGKSSGEPQAQHVPISPNPTPTVTPTPPSPPAPEKTTIKIHYSDLKSDVYAGQTDVKFDYAPVRYVAKKISVSEEFIQTQYLKKFGTNKITQNIEQAYARDSDNDGVIDRNDANPNTWDVSERDLRMFASLAYAKEEQIKQFVRAVNSPNDPASQKLLADFYARDNVKNESSLNFDGQSKLEELLSDWEVLLFYNGSDVPILGTGLDFTLFGNGKKKDGTYENVVIAFRGTTNVADNMSNLGLWAGMIPEQSKDTKIILEYLEQYQPNKIYATGHSLGGYNTQYFVSHYLLNSKFKDNFVHSAIFNPAILKTRLFSREILKEARKITDKLLVTDYTDNSDKTEPMTKQKTNAYVVEGDWVDDKLGSYDGTTWIDERNAISFTLKNHALISFSQKDPQLKQLFSKGYRMDKHYLHDDVDNDGLTDYQEKRLGTDSKQATVLKGKDTDRDGFSDRLEIELGSNWLDSKKIIDLKEYYSISAQEKQLLALVETHTEKGKFLGVQGMEMNAKVENNQLVYTPNASPLNLGITQDTEWQVFLQSGKNIIQGDSQNNVLEAKGEMQILYGASGNDILKTSTGVDILVGGSGQDTFVLTEESIKSGKMDFISDFAAEDKLNLSALKSIFNINHLNLKWSDLLTTQAQDNDALVWNEQEHTLSYKSKGSQNVHVLAKFDDDVDMARISAGLIG